MLPALRQQKVISIHAPVKGATNDALIRAFYDFPALNISIHAPVKGATERHLLVAPPVEISIHAPVKGATLCNHFIKACLGFQSTLP